MTCTTQLHSQRGTMAGSSQKVCDLCSRNLWTDHRKHAKVGNATDAVLQHRSQLCGQAFILPEYPQTICVTCNTKLSQACDMQEHLRQLLVQKMHVMIYCSFIHLFPLDIYITSLFTAEKTTHPYTIHSSNTIVSDVDEEGMCVLKTQSQRPGQWALQILTVTAGVEEHPHMGVWARSVVFLCTGHALLTCLHSPNQVEFNSVTQAEWL